MRGSQWRTLAVATVAAIALTGCGGDQAGDAGAEAGEDAGAVDQTEQPTTGAQQTGQQPAAQVPENLPEGVTAEQFAQGQQLFSAEGGCHACHGPQATGTQLAPDLTDDQWLNLDNPTVDDVVQLIQNGVPQPIEHPAPMPPMGGANLADDQVQALAAYVMGIAQG